MKRIKKGILAVLSCCLLLCACQSREAKDEPPVGDITNNEEEKNPTTVYNNGNMEGGENGQYSENDNSGETQVNTQPAGQENYEIMTVTQDMTGLQHPAGICSDGKFLYICDEEKHCVVQVDADSLEVVDTFGELGMEEGNFSKPVDITYVNDRFYVLDAENHSVQVFSDEFQYEDTYNLRPLITEAGFGRYQSVEADGEGNIYVSTFASDYHDAHIVKINADHSLYSFEEEAIGYLCGDGETVYFANQLEIFKESDTVYGARTGENHIYRINDGHLEEIYESIAVCYCKGNIVRSGLQHDHKTDRI